MSQPKQPEREIWTATRTLPSRLDLNSAFVVEQGLKMQDLQGTDQAAKFLQTNGIGMGVAIRVLAQPSARRKNQNRVGSGKPLAPSPSLPRILRKPHMKGSTPF